MGKCCNISVEQFRKKTIKELVRQKTHYADKYFPLNSPSHEFFRRGVARAIDCLEALPAKDDLHGLKSKLMMLDPKELSGSRELSDLLDAIIEYQKDPCAYKSVAINKRMWDVLYADTVGGTRIPRSIIDSINSNI